MVTAVNAEARERPDAPPTAVAVEEGNPPIHLTDDAIAEDEKSPQPRSRLQRCLDILNWKPPWCRWDPNKPPVFSIWINILFGFAGAFTVANLYYNHPILNVLAKDFDVPFLVVSRIPTLMQAGYATGLLFVCPLGDLFPRRPFTLTLVFFTASMWIGLCVTNNFNVFLAISFITAITTVTPQIMLPLVGELAPPSKRAVSLSIVVSGNLLGIVIARILSGVVTNYTAWRNIYWIALALQYFICSLLWLFMPDYPSSNPSGLNYFRMLYSILQLYRRYAVLVHAGAISFCNSAAFTSFWTTLTFLLASPPYSYNSVVIGLFALIGICGTFTGPLYARYLVQPYAPWFSVVLGSLIGITGISLGTYTGRFTVAGPILQAFALDAAMQLTQIANRSAIYAVEPTGRNRVNTAFMLMTFTGQLTGTAAGNELYERGGWLASGSLSVALVGLNLVFCAIRGPWEEGWYGWTGGFQLKRNNKTTVQDDHKVVQTSNGAADEEKSGDEHRNGADEQQSAAQHNPGTDDKVLDNKTARIDNKTAKKDDVR